VAYAEAAALCRVAPEGEVMASPATAQLVSVGVSHSAFRLEPSTGGPYLLVSQTPERTGPGLPGALAAALEGPLAARREELGLLSGAWADTLAGSASAVFVGGEPGIGKSRLLAELGRRVLADGALVLYGTTHEDPGYGPVVEALSSLRGLAPDRLEALAGPVLDSVARLVPGLSAADPVALETDELTRRRLFDDVADLLARISADTPVLLILEDLHWAAAGTVSLVRHLLRRADRGQVMVVVSYRSTELGRSHPLFALMADLTGQPSVHRLALGGLDASGLDELMATAGEADALTLMDLTGGNPLFALSLLRAGGQLPDRLPGTIRDVLADRVSRLSPDAKTVIDFGAVCGPTFDLALVEAGAGLEPGRDPLDGLEDAIEAGLLRETDSGRYAFAHGLIHRVVLDGLSDGWRRATHRRLGEILSEATSVALGHSSLAARPGAGSDGIEMVAESRARRLLRRDEEAVLASASHWLAAGDETDPERAAEAVLAAAMVLEDRTAWEELYALLARAVGELGPHTSPGTRALLMIEQAEAAHVVGQIEMARRLASEAADVAFELGDPFLAADAAAAYGAWAFGGMPDPRAAELQLRAMAMVEGNPGPDAERKLSRLQCARAWHLLATEARADEAEALAAEALATGRRLGDTPTVFNALHVLSNAVQGTNRLAEREAYTAERVALTGGDPLFSHQTAQQLAGIHLERGDVAEFGRIARALMDQGSGGIWTRLVTATEQLNTLALIEGRLADADAGVERLSTMPGVAEYHFYFLSAQLAAVRREQGRGAELIGLAPTELGQGPILFPLAGALLRAEAGQLAQAEATVQAAMARFGSLGRDQAWSVMLALLAELTALIGRPDWCDPLIPALAPLSGLIAVAGYGMVALGAVDRFLGMLHATAGRREEAEACYRSALILEERAGSPTWTVRTRIWLGRLLGPGDDEGRVILGQARDEAERIGMNGQAALAAALLG